MVPPVAACGCQGFQLLCIRFGYGQVDGPRQSLVAATPLGLEGIERRANGGVELLGRIQQQLEVMGKFCDKEQVVCEHDGYQPAALREERDLSAVGGDAERTRERQCVAIEGDRAQVDPNVVRGSNVVQVLEERFHTEAVLWRTADGTLVDAGSSLGCLVRVAGSGANSDGAPLVDDLKERF